MRETLTDVGSSDPRIRDHTCTESDLEYFRNPANFPTQGAPWWKARGGRVGLQQTLHRIAGIHKDGELVAVKIRIGRAVGGVARELIPPRLLELRPSILIIAPPGKGKTTLLRDLARVLSSDPGRTVVVVDKSGEVGGFGKFPHRCLGSIPHPVPRFTATPP